MVRQSDHPLGMTILETQDSVQGYDGLNEGTVRRLMTAEYFQVLTPSMQRRVLGQVIPSPSSLVAEVGGSAVVITNQWVVSIHGDSLAHCIEALLNYRNAIAVELGATVTGVLQTPVVENTGPLREVVTRRENERSSQRTINKFYWLIAGALAGAALSAVGSVLIGG
jgi:hypothetical protein